MVVDAAGFEGDVGDGAGAFTGDTGLTGTDTEVAVGGTGVADGNEGTVNVGEGATVT